MNSFTFEFVIPRKSEDLLVSQSPNQFYVSEVYRDHEIPERIEECKSSLNELGSDFILEHFGTMFSVLRNFRNLDFKILQSCYNDVIVEELSRVNNTLYILFEDDDIHPETKLKMLNVTKMSIYIAVEFLKSFQEKVDQTYSLVINKRGQKNTKLVKLKEEHNWDWEENEKSALDILLKIVKQPLNRLWDPPLPEEEFVRLIEDCCYSVLAKPSVTSAKMKPTRDILYEILAVLITQYNNAISCKVKIVQMLKLYEHLVSILAQAVVFFVQKYNCRSLIKEIVMEIIETGSEMDSYSQDHSSSRVFSNFIVEIAAQEAELVLPSVNILTPNLNCDPYSMRICALTVMAEIVANVLHSEVEDSLTEEKRKTRDAFLEHLLDHIEDVNVFVRSRVLKLWQTIFKRNAVPKHFIILLLDLTIQRLNDKSSNVVKNAIQLVTLMLQHNPYGALLDEEAVKMNLRALKLQMIENESKKKKPSIFKLWFCNRSEFSEFMANKLKGDADTSNCKSEDDDSASESEGEEEEADDGKKKKLQLAEYLSKIRQSVIKCDFETLFIELKDFERIYLKNSKLLNRVNDVIQYYQWILGNMCKEDENVLLIPAVSKCTTDTELKSLINQPISVEDQKDLTSDADRAVFTYCEDYLKFVETIRTATNLIGDLMLSGLVAETLEAIEFFKAASAFGLSGAEEGLRSMLLLISCKESGIKEAVVTAYKSIYLNTDSANSYEAAVVITEKLTSLLKKVTYEQKDSLHDLIKQWAINDDLESDFIQVLWDKYSRKLPNTSAEDSQAAIVLISMYASGKPEVIQDNIDVLTRHGLSRENSKNYALVKYTCTALRVLQGAKTDAGVLMKYPMNSELIESLFNIILEQFTNLENDLYSEIAMEVITALYHLSESPDTVCERLIQALLKKAHSLCVTDNENKLLNEEFLIRICLIVSQIAVSQWQYLENDVICELKRKSAENRSTRTKLKSKSKKGNRTKGDSIANEKKSLIESTMTDNFEEDDAAVAADERITESIRMVCENELLSNDSMLSILSKLIIKVCQNPDKYPRHRLQSAASIALSKLMMISSEFCSQHIQLFITVLEKTNIPEVKINLILAFGDLTFRFPNNVEPWTVYFYNRLRDESKDVRYTSLLVVSHLITNEMIKVRGQMSDVALCLVDEDPTIKSHAFRLFHELSVKGNALYNVMPDIISRLSHPDYRTSEENFQTILKSLMKLITKDRHLEAIVEKLCHRFGGAADERQCIDLSYCLTLVSYSDRTLQKLIDNIVCYAEKLNHARVHKNFTNIIIACKKQAKVGKLADLAQELENKIDIILTRGIDNLETNFLKPSKTPAKTAKTPRMSKSVTASSRNSTRVSKLKTPRRLKLASSSSEDSDESE